jgi:outer membrane protein OmpU
MYKMHFAPAEFDIGVNSGDQMSWVSLASNAAGSDITQGGYFRAPYGSIYTEPIRANDSEKLTYYMPKVEGF